MTFLDNSLKSETSRSLLESRYPEQLTLAYILRDDFDRARYYLNLSLQSVLQVMVMVMMVMVMVMVMMMIVMVMMMVIVMVMVMVMMMVMTWW